MSTTPSELAGRERIRAIRSLIEQENGDRAFEVKTPKERVEAEFAFLSKNPTAEKVELIVGLASVKYHAYERRAAAFRALVPAVKAGGETRAEAIAGYNTMIASLNGRSLEEEKILIALCEEDPSDDLVGLLGTIASRYGIYSKESALMDTLIKIGTKAAVEGIKYASLPGHEYRGYADFALYKSGLLKQVGTEDAAAAMAELVHGEVDQIRQHLNNLADLGDIGFSHIEALAAKGLPCTRPQNRDSSEKLVSLAFQVITEIDTPRARAAEIRIQGLFQERLAHIDTEFRSREPESAPHRPDLRDEIPYELGSQCKELFAYSFADPDAALKTLAVGLAKSRLRPAVNSVMCDTVRKIYDAQPAHVEQGRQVLCDANTKAAIETLFRDVTEEEDLYQIIRQAIHMAEHPVQQVKAAFNKYPDLEDRVVAGLDLNKPETSLNAALCLDQVSFTQGELLSTQLKRFPESWAMKQAYEALSRWDNAKVRNFVRTMAAIQTPEASELVVECLQKINEKKPVGRYAIERMAASPYAGVATPIIKIAQKVGAELEGVQALIALRHAEGSEDGKRALSKVMLPLIMTIAAPDHVHKVAARVKREGLSELGAVFAAVDQDRIVPEAEAGYFTGLFQSAVEQDNVRRTQKATHQALLGTIKNDAAP